MLYLPISFIVGLMMLVSPAIGSAAAAFAGALTLVVFFYLYFVTAALIMDNVPLGVAIMRSLRLVRENFWATLGFIVLSNLIGLGIALLLVAAGQPCRCGQGLWRSSSTPISAPA